MKINRGRLKFIEKMKRRSNIALVRGMKQEIVLSNISLKWWFMLVRMEDISHRKNVDFIWILFFRSATVSAITHLGLSRKY